MSFPEIGDRLRMKRLDQYNGYEATVINKIPFDYIQEITLKWHNVPAPFEQAGIVNWWFGSGWECDFEIVRKPNEWENDLELI